MNITIILLICGCIVTLTSGISIYLFLKNKKIKNQNNVLNTQLKDFNSRINPLQLEVLEAKLNPHLFKNILNSIQSHAYKTYFAIDRLSNVLDYILYESRKKESVFKEIAYWLYFSAQRVGSVCFFAQIGDTCKRID